MKQILTAALFLGIQSIVHAQTGIDCPPSTVQGIHVVQQGETLYGISKKYKVSVTQLRTWNNLTENDILKVCTSLSVTASSVKNDLIPTGYGYIGNKNTGNKNVPKSTATPKTHTVQEGESLLFIARKYGFTVERLLAMNNMLPTDPIYVDQELIVNDCEKTISTNRTDIPTSYGYGAGKGVTSSPQAIGNLTETTYYSATYNWNPNYSKVIHIVSQDQLSQNETMETIAALHGLTAQEVADMNGLSVNSVLVAGQRLTVENRSQTVLRSSNDYSYTPPPTDIPQQYNQPSKPNQQGASTQNSSITSPKKPDVIADANITANTPYVKNNTDMTSEEMKMVDEINLVRYNPEAYIPFIEEYITELKQSGERSSTITVAKELIEELKKTPRLSVLQTTQCIYTAAVKHGNDQRRRGDTDHQGSDGSWPWDRVMRECPMMKDGNENLVGGPSDIRKAVILLLVDDGIEGRGHRKTMLQPDWKYVACHKMGTIGTMPNCWVQKFGY